jgi:hypothetical protein
VIRRLVVAGVVAIVAAAAVPGAAQVVTPDEHIAPVRRVVDDDINLYTKERLRSDGYCQAIRISGSKLTKK